MKIQLDELDRRILLQLQQDASINNQQLAERVHASAPTCLRRVRRLREHRVITAEVALLDHALIDGALTAMVEITLDRQHTEALEAFEARMTAEAAVLQCYRVSPGPDFVLILQVADMPGYHLLASRLFAADANIRNVRVFFVTHRAKFLPDRLLAGQ
jgi:Lrp/AsnC family leucine-responsive transcriptional regulator